MISCIGFYAVYTNHKAATWALFVFNLVCALCLVGSMPLMNFSTPLFAVEPTGCLGYFDNTDPNYNRCWDLVRHTQTGGGTDSERAALCFSPRLAV